MSLFPLYSRRKRESQSTGTDVFQYEAIPRDVRVQLMMNMDNALQRVCGQYNDTLPESYEALAVEMREELGVHNLSGKRPHDHQEEVSAFFHDLATTEQVLDILELWYAIARIAIERRHIDDEPLTYAASRINARLLEARIGFELVDGRIIEKSSEFLHQEAVLPALHVLSEKRFEGANKEFRDAHDAYRNGEYEDCLTDCLKAFESVIKVIADGRDWGLPANATAKALIAALYDNEFVPAYTQSQFTGLRSMLEASVPTTRNKASGHGRGTEKRSVPKSLAAFQLHQTAAIIVFLSELDK